MATSTKESPDFAGDYILDSIKIRSFDGKPVDVKSMVQELDLLQPYNEVATNLEEAIVNAKRVEYPLVVRPSYVLGGRAMEIVYNDDELKTYMTEAVKVSNQSPVLLDHFLNKAIELSLIHI